MGETAVPGESHTGMRRICKAHRLALTRNQLFFLKMMLNETLLVDMLVILLGLQNFSSFPESRLLGRTMEKWDRREGRAQILIQ